MKLQWLDDTDAFYDGCFSYLKAKFPNKRPKILGGEKYPEQPIYNETVVALELIHHVLRRIEDRSAYTRKDYEDAQGNDDLKIKIINFYKVLALNTSDDMANAFQNFAKHYYWDSRIYNYKKFLQSPAGLQDLDFSDPMMWSVEKFDTGIFFDFLDRYSAFLESASTKENDEFKKSDWLNRKIDEQNRIYENLLFSYDQLVTEKIRFGICVFDVRFPIQLEDGFNNYQFISSAKFLGDFARYMGSEFAQDDGVLLVVNHAHVLSLGYVAITFLVIYKIKNYESQERLVEHYSKRIQSYIGTRSIEQIRVTNCEKMIKKTYPSDHFVGELVGQKQKKDFQDRFLKYFVSSSFLLNVDSDELLKEQVDLYSVFFNDFRCFQEKIYIQPKTPKTRKSLLDQLNTARVFLDDLIDEKIVSNFDKYFNINDLEPNAINQLNLIEFLYHQQATVSKAYTSLLDDFIRVEKLLTRIMYQRRIELFYSDKQRKAFYARPAFSKLNVVFQQFILITMMNCFLKANHLLREFSLSQSFEFKNIGYRVHHFLKEMNGSFPEVIRIDALPTVENELKNYQKFVLKGLIKKENVEFKKAKKREESIQNYLELVFKEDVIVLRFIFEGGFVQGSEDKAKVFDSMFRDYVDNLKRRHTQGVKLLGHVGLYVPYRNEHYIDATLFFKNDTNLKVNSADLINDVSEYWSNYVVKKSEQIQTYISKQKKNDDMVNPFDDFSDVSLVAKSVKVIQLAGELHDEYLEVYPNQKRNKQYMIETIAKFYAYAPHILIAEQDLSLMPRKDSLILGRKTKSKREVEPSKKERETRVRASKQASKVVENNDSSKRVAEEYVNSSSAIGDFNEIQTVISGPLKQNSEKFSENIFKEDENILSDVIESERESIKTSIEEDERKPIAKSDISERSRRVVKVERKRQMQPIRVSKLK